MQEREIVERILADHERLRELLDGVEALAGRAAQGDEAAAKDLPERGLGLYEAFAAHLRLEDSLLVPALQAAGPDGPVRAARLEAEHREQRELLHFLASRLREAGRPTLLVRRELQLFVEVVRDDMAHEEDAILDEGVLGRG